MSKSAKNVVLSERAQRKMFAHVLKHHQSDCIGILLGNFDENHFEVTDVVPLFHDRVFASALESAFMMVSCVYETDKIIGVYDAPLKLKSGEATPLSSLALNISQQIKTTTDMQESLIVSVRVPPYHED